MFIIENKKNLLLIAAFIMTGSVLVIGALGLNFGIDFTGGSLTEVSYKTAPEKTQLENEIRSIGLDDLLVRESLNEEGKVAFLISTVDLTEEKRIQLEEAVTSIGEEGEVDRFTSIGPVIGQELRDKAIWAIIGVASIIILYVAYAFAGIGTPVSSWTYGAITIFVLIHDVLVPTALMSFLGYFAGVEVDVLFVMALLAVLGYSVNDTIVIFDRVRENLIANRTEHRKKREEAGVVHEDVTYTLNKPYRELVSQAVSGTLARSINTSITTLVALVALYLLGGSVTQTFALVLMAGVLAGTYSSICIASPLVVTYAERRANKNS